MEENMNTINMLHVLSSTTCKDMEELVKDLNASMYESKNMTYEAYTNLLRTPNCIPKPYLGVQGIQKWIITIILVSFLLFGLIGNLLSATIMFRRSRRGLSSYFYLALLAIVDICVLYSGCLLFFFEIAFNYHPQSHATSYCRLGFYIQHLFTYISAWLIVAVTFERFIVVRFPFQSIRICRLHVAYAITTFIIIFFTIYTAHCFFTLDIVRSNLGTDNGYDQDYRICDLVVHRRLLAFLDLCFYSVIPSILILIFNMLIILTMFYAIKQRRNYLQASSFLPTTDICPRNLNQKTKSSSSMRTQFFRSRSVESSPAIRSFNPHGRICQNGLKKPVFSQKSQQVLFDSTSATGIRLTCLLLLISFMFVICTLPISIHALIADFFPEHDSTIVWQMTRISFTILMYLNHTINFVLYCLTGRAFRSECRKLLCGLWALRDIHISCTMNPGSDKQHNYHQQIVLQDRHRIITSQQQQQRVKRSYL